MSERWMSWPAILHTPIGDALRIIRLRHDRPSWIGSHWNHVSVKRRVERQRWEIDRAARGRAEKPWHPPEGRESPREEWMSWRRSMISYAFPGYMRFKHGRAAPLVGRTRLYDVYAPRADWRT